VFHAYFDLFLQALARNLPWILGALAVAGMLGWSPLGRSIARALRDRSRTLELEESLGAQLSDLQRTLSEVNERLDVTEQRLFRLPAADARGKDAAKNADPPPRVATPV
jgi:hypothetical protein